jgi:RNA polymerase sigma-70 factor (ECF subfamily)
MPQNDAAEELVADTVAAACQSFRTLRDRTKTKPWLMKILSNRFISGRRKRRNITSLSLLDEGAAAGSFSLFDELEAALQSDSNPEKEVIRKLMDEDFERALAAIPESFRIAIVLCDVEGYSYELIGRTLGIPVGTVRSRIARGRRLLQKQLWFYLQELEIVPAQKRPGKKGTHHGKEETCTCDTDQLHRVDQAVV